LLKAQPDAEADVPFVVLTAQRVRPRDGRKAIQRENRCPGYRPRSRPRENTEGLLIDRISIDFAALCDS